MSNHIVNATFLEGVDGVSVDNATLSVDEAVYGALGRAVVLATPAGPATVTIYSPSAGGLVLNQTVEASIYAWGPPGMTVSVRSGTIGSGFVSSPIPLVSSADPVGPRRGIPGSFNFYRGRFAAPRAGSARFLVTGTTTGPTPLAIMKPFLDPGPLRAGAPWQPWQAGPHVSADLNLASWPTSLPLPTDNSLQFEGIPTRKGFAGDSGVPATRPVTRTQRFKMRGELSLDMEQRDTLDQFFRNSQGPFWITRPDTHQICQATWLEDGEPSDGGLLRGNRKTQVGLLLKVA